MMAYKKCCINCEYAFSDCDGCEVEGKNAFENFVLRDELAKIENGGKTMSNNNIRYGWVCPKCGAVMAPDEKRCVNCKGSIIVEYGSVTNVSTSPTIRPTYPSDIAISTVSTNGSKDYKLTSEVEQ